MKTLLVKVKNLENCHNKGFSIIRKLSDNYLQFNRTMIVDTNNNVCGLIIYPHVAFVNTVDVFNGVKSNELLFEKSLNALMKQFKDTNQCMIFKLNPIFRFSRFVKLNKPVRGMRYATNEEQEECMSVFLKTLLSLGLTDEELYSYCMRNEIFDTYVNLLYKQEYKEDVKI